VGEMDVEGEKETLSLFDFRMSLHEGTVWKTKTRVLEKPFTDIQKQINHKYFIISKQMFISLHYSRCSAKGQSLMQDLGLFASCFFGDPFWNRAVLH